MQRIGSFEKTDAGKDWRQEEKGMTEDEMVGQDHQQYHWVNEFEQAQGNDGQGKFACSSPLGCKDWDKTEQLNNNNVFG